MKWPRLLITLFILTISVLSISLSCSKEKEMCNKNLKLHGPDSVLEGEDITLLPYGQSEYQAINTYYYWKYADMSGFYTTVSGMEEVYDTDPVTIEKVDIRDEGDYYFRIESGSDECEGMAEGKHTLDVIPKTSPCFEGLSTQYLNIAESFSSGTIFQSYTPDLDVASGGGDFEVELSMPLFSYYLRFEFDIPIPEYSSTYTLRNSYLSASDADIPEDPIIQASVLFIPSNETYDAYRVADNQENLYLKREGDLMYLSFCDVVFIHQTIPGRTITVSGKVQIQV